MLMSTSRCCTFEGTPVLDVYANAVEPCLSTSPGCCRLVSVSISRFYVNFHFDHQYPPLYPPPCPLPSQVHRAFQCHHQRHASFCVLRSALVRHYHPLVVICVLKFWLVVFACLLRKLGWVRRADGVRRCLHWKCHTGNAEQWQSEGRALARGIICGFVEVLKRKRHVYKSRDVTDGCIATNSVIVSMGRRHVKRFTRSCQLVLAVSTIMHSVRRITAHKTEQSVFALPRSESANGWHPQHKSSQTRHLPVSSLKRIQYLL